MDRMEALAHVNRPKLGDDIPVSVFRVFRQFSAHYSEDILGEKGARTVFVHAGRELGLEIGKQLYTEDLNEYLEKVKGFVYESNIGILSTVLADSEKLIMQLDECVTCAGMPNIGKKICHFEVGLVGGVVQAYLDKNVYAYETKCNANGDDCCEVTVELNPTTNFFD
jgi:uncharacterized protein